MKKRKRLPRLLHGAFCLGAVLLALVFVRFTCGPTQLLTEKAALRRAQRQSLHIPREPVYTREIAGSQFFAVWDGQELYTYTAQWVRPFRKGYSYNANSIPIRPSGCGPSAKATATTQTGRPASGSCARP